MNPLDDLKMTLRSLLIASKTGLTLAELSKLYREVDGRPLPIRELGFSSPMDFIDSLPDVICKNYVRGNLVLSGVNNESTMHIAKMVSRQKVPSSKKSRGRVAISSVPAGRRPPPLLMSGGRHPPLLTQSSWKYKSNQSNPPPRRGNPFQSQQRTFPQPQQQRNPPPQAQRNIPPRMQNRMPQSEQQHYQHPHARSPQSETPSPASISQATRAPHDWNRPADQSGPNTRSVPPSIQNNIRILLDGISDGVLGSTFAQMYLKRFGSPISYGSLGFDTLQEMLQSLTDVLQVKPRPTGFKVLSLRSAESHSTLRPARPPPPSEQAEARSQSPLVPPASERTGSGSSGKRKTRQKSGGSDEFPVTTQIKDNIRKVLTNFPRGLNASLILNEYRQTLNSDLPLGGRASVIELLATIPDVVTIERPDKHGDWILYDARQRPASETLATSVSRDWEQDFRTMLTGYPNGIFLHELPIIYEQIFQTTLDPLALGFTSLQDLVFYLADKKEIVDSVERVDNNKIVIKPVRTPVNRVNPMSPGNSNRPPAMAMPDDVVLVGELYQPQPIPADIVDTSWFAVIVAYVHHPGQISIQLLGPDTTEALEVLMDRMERAYKDNEAVSAYYMVPDDMLRKGLVCAAIYPDHVPSDYHRVVITDRPSVDMVEVYYADYGGISQVKKDSLRLLKREFMDLPAQAIDAKLSGITMANGQYWTNDSKTRLLELTSDKHILGHVRALNDRVLHLCLCDTAGDQDVHINDVLVAENHAVFEQSTVNAVESEVELEYGDDNEEESARTKRYIKKVPMPDSDVIHLINFDNKPFLAGPEIASFIWDSNQLHSMLRQKKVPIPDKMTVGADDYPELFKEFELNDVKSLKDKKYTTLYPLNKIPLILETFHHPDQDLSNKIKAMCEAFNPDSPYWQGVDEDSQDSGADKDEDFESLASACSYEELKTTLMSLTFMSYLNELKKSFVIGRYRQQILAEMSTASQSKANKDYVDEIQQIEIKINTLNKKMALLEKSGLKIPADSKTPQLSESDEYIQKCIGFQYPSPNRPSQTTSGTSDSVLLDAADGLDALSLSADVKVSPSINRVAPMPQSALSNQVSSSIGGATCSSAITTSSPINDSSVQSILSHALTAIMQPQQNALTAPLPTQPTIIPSFQSTLPFPSSFYSGATTPLLPQTTYASTGTYPQYNPNVAAGWLNPTSMYTAGQPLQFTSQQPQFPGQQPQFPGQQPQFAGQQPQFAGQQLQFGGRAAAAFPGQPQHQYTTAAQQQAAQQALYAQYNLYPNPSWSAPKK